MPSIDITLPYRGKLIRLERYFSEREGREKVRIYGDDNAIMEPPGLGQIFDLIGYALPTGERVDLVEVEVVDDGDASVQRVTGPQGLIDAITAYFSGQSPQDIREALQSRARQVTTDQALADGESAAESASLGLTAEAAAMPDVDRSALEQREDLGLR